MIPGTRYTLIVYRSTHIVYRSTSLRVRPQTTASRHELSVTWREGSDSVVVIERGQHTRHSRRWGLVQAERVRDGYRHSIIVDIEMRALSLAHSSL